MPLVPRERRFFEMFRNAIANTVEGSIALRVMLSDYGNRDVHAQTVRDREHDGDGITHEMMNALSRTFVTPFDREDIHQLAGAIDDILDYAEEVAETLVLYNIEEPTEHLAKMSDVLVSAARELQLAIGKLETPKDVAPHWIQVNALENEGDSLHRKAVAQLFRPGADPIDVIKWKEIYRLIETAIDKCEDAANIIENIVIKHG